MHFRFTRLSLSVLCSSLMEAKNSRTFIKSLVCGNGIYKPQMIFMLPVFRVCTGHMHNTLTNIQKTHTPTAESLRIRKKAFHTRGTHGVARMMSGCDDKNTSIQLFTALCFTWTHTHTQTHTRTTACWASSHCFSDAYDNTPKQTWKFL